MKEGAGCTSGTWQSAALLAKQTPNTLRTAPRDAEAAAPSSHEGQGRSMQQK